MKIAVLYKRTAIAFFAATLLILFNQTGGFASIKDMSEYLPDDYLGNEFKWSMVLYLPDVKDSLSYNGSTLDPLTKVSVRFNEYPSAGIVQSKAYEEFWYHKKAVLGMRRRNQVRLAAASNGAIILCPRKEKESTDCATAITNALVRVMLDVQFRGANTSLVVVPDSDHPAIVTALERYGFYSEDKLSNNLNEIALSLRLRGYPLGPDKLLYLKK
ncbi:hypothetical protein BH11CYA1_BH11CYA1_40440 [soil metagenome]